MPLSSCIHAHVHTPFPYTRPPENSAPSLLLSAAPDLFGIAHYELEHAIQVLDKAQIYAYGRHKL